MIRAIATVGYVGLIKPAPGTWGSLAAIPLAWLVFLAGGWLALAVGCVASFAIGWWATLKLTQSGTDKDPSYIVIDELAGQWIALLPVAIGATHAQAGFWQLWPGVVTAFIAFRLFDIWKPGPVGWADRRGDALGVMLDDVIAGFGAALCVMAGAWIAHGL
ncbi:phosphatidylglycerophosphatase A family protein [Litoreibacter roseus]|uniref:Phosphatidylglycerophosphatase A n=1 Tax=Litoreibacter roseus TaxID=2601869 RepID=A0A6N6JKP9_9RHOB|nr:phosphatidylglycerophosphatase A [Litoreibacter roseus]GFE66891.1 phosphatidylglycerophosphatase A [Litoreibacter roseus]